MEILLSILLSWKLIIFCLGLLIMGLFKYKFLNNPNERVVMKELKAETIVPEKNSLLHQLSKGIRGLFKSRKGTLSMMLFFCSLIPMTVLCWLGKMDGTAYGICLSAVTTAVVAVFCHTQSKTDQILGASQTTSTSVQTVTGPGGTSQNIDNTTSINADPVIPIMSGIDPQPDNLVK